MSQMLLTEVLLQLSSHVSDKSKFNRYCPKLADSHRFSQYHNRRKVLIRFLVFTPVKVL
jgi:hypothetical protein